MHRAGDAGAGGCARLVRLCANRQRVQPRADRPRAIPALDPAACAGRLCRRSLRSPQGGHAVAEPCRRSARSVSMPASTIMPTRMLPIYLMAMVIASARSFSMPSTASLLPNIVTREQFPQAVAFSSSSMQFASMVGPAIGGFVYAADRREHLSAAGGVAGGGGAADPDRARRRRVSNRAAVARPGRRPSPASAMSATTS